jgi:colanic acid biosynthesis glycosyl transferase WcaI
MTRIVDELVGRGMQVHVVTSLPWYRNHRIEPGWAGAVVRVEPTPWGSITRIDPFAGSDKTNLARRALGFVGFTLVAGVQALRAGGWFSRVDSVLVMSPPLTLAPVGWLTARLRRAEFVLNIQDVFPDAAIETGAITNRWVIGALRVLERWSYRRAAAVTVLSDDLQDNVVRKLDPTEPDRAQVAQRVPVIPNFVDTATIVPGDRLTPYRRELGIGDEPIVLYAGNLGFSQSFELLFAAARQLPEVTFLINGDGSARARLEAEAADLANVVVAGYVDQDRLAELLATGDIHVVLLKRGLGRVSVPSKSYSIMAAARPLLASIDPDTAIPAILAESGGGVTVPPDDPTAFIAALRELLAAPERCAELGRAGRSWVEEHASPAAVGEAYFDLLGSRCRGSAGPGR